MILIRQSEHQSDNVQHIERTNNDDSFCFLKTTNTHAHR